MLKKDKYKLNKQLKNTLIITYQQENDIGKQDNILKKYKNDQ